MSKSRLTLTNAARFVRSLRRRRVRVSLIILFTTSIYFMVILPISLWKTHQNDVAAYDASIAHLPKPRVFVAAMLANCAPLLSRYWIPSLLGLVDQLGPDNVFVSILENGSQDETRSLLVELQRNLSQRRVPYSFRFEEDFRDGETFQKDGLLLRLLGKEGTRDNWVMRENGWVPRRISYLAELRNMVLEPLKNSSRRYDRILFFNDVIFSADDAIRLLQTNNGEYAAACGLDYFKPHLFYDTFAMRDINGNPMISILFPFFHQGKTRQQFLSRAINVEVKSCWNGMVSLNAAPFQNESQPLRFRAIPSSLALLDGHLEGSEACLIHADMQAHWLNLPSFRSHNSAQILVNPLVRVSYNKSAYNAQNSVLQFFIERMTGSIVALAYDIRDWWFQCQFAQQAAERREKIREWGRKTGLQEVGTYCLIDHMQILTPSGWAHV